MKIELFTKKIHLKNVELGDHVLSLNNDGEVIYGEVTDLFRPTVAKANQVTVTTGSASLTTSLDHPLLTYDKDTTRMVYREVKDLAVGDPLITIGADSEILLTPIISIEAATTEDETFYDMTVEPDNCYFAGVHPDHLVVSHNSVTTYYPIWHLEVENLLVLKNNKGTQDTRVRRLDYGAQWNAYLIRRALRKQDITLFSPHEVPDLYEAFFSRDPAEFERLYEKYESSAKIKYKKSVPGRPLLETFLIERQETGRIYPFFADNVNVHSPFLDPVYLSNLCVAGDTTIRISAHKDGSDAKTIRIDELSTIDGDVYVLSHDLSNNVPSWERITAFAQTSPKAKVLRLTDDHGNELVVTPDHQVYTQRGYVKACDLKSDDTILTWDKYLRTLNSDGDDNVHCQILP